MTDTPEFEYLRLVELGTEPDILEAAVNYAVAAMPQWVPRVGNTELVLMESLALMLGVEVTAIQMLPGLIVEQLMQLYGIVRDQGTAATSRVEFTVTDSNPVQVIPAGTILRFEIQATGETVDLLTVETLSIITSETLTGQVDVVAAETGTAGNGTAAGVFLAVVDNLPFIESVTLAEPLLGGLEVETDDLFYGRASAALARLSTTLVGPDSFAYAALTQPGVGRAKVFDLYNPATPGTNPAVGHVTVAVASPTGDALSSADMLALQNWLASQALASLSVHVIAPTYTTVNLNITVKAVPGYTAAQVEDAVTGVIENWINPVTWDWSSTVSQYQLIAVLSGASGVAAVTSVPADIPLAGKAPLPILGTLNVTVTA